jgi:hypothetical protein
MDAVTIFCAEILACMTISALILLRLQRLLRKLGSEVCEQGGGATEFWLAYTQLMMVIAPVLMVAWLSRAGMNAVLVEQLKSSLAVVLSGQFLGLALVGRAVWKSIVPSAPAARAPVNVMPTPAGANS